MASPEEEALVSKLAEVNKASEGLTSSVETFEEATKAAAALCEKYMGPKKPGPDDPPAKKVEEFKKSVTAHGEAAKAVTSSVTEHAGVLGAIKALMEADLEAIRDMDPAEKPEALKEQIAAMQEEVQRQVTEKAEAEEALHKQMEEIQQECNKEKEQLLEQHVAQVNDLQSQIESVTDEKEITTQKLIVEQEKVAQLMEVVATRDASIKELIAKGDALEAEAAIAAQSAKEYRHERDVLQAQLNVSEATRLNDASAYRKSVAAHTQQTENLEKRVGEGKREAEVAKTEKEAMRARLVDDHLREHIRVLQEENNHLRDEKIQLVHEQTKRSSSSTNVTGVLSAQLAEYNAEREKLERTIRQLREEAAGSEKIIFDLTTSMDTQRSTSAAAIETLNTQLQREKMTSERSASMQPAAAAAPAPKLHRTVQTQATDEHWKTLERDLIFARAHNVELSDRIEGVEKSSEEHRKHLEAKLLSEAEQSASQVSSLSNQLKAARYKGAKLQQQCNSATERAASVMSELHADPYAAADEKLIERCHKLEKQAVEAALEVESLKVRLRTVQREVRDHRATEELKLKDSYPSPQQQQQRLYGSGNQRDFPQDNGGSIQTPLVVSGVEKAKERAQKQADIDQQLLQLHEESVKLDEKERVVHERRTTSEQQIKDRLNWIEGAVLYWSRAAGTEVGPDGESKEQMVGKLQSEKKNLLAQLQQVEKGIINFFQEVGDRRGKIFNRSSDLLAERAKV